MSNPAKSRIDIEAFKAKLAADVQAAQGRAEAAKRKVHDGVSSFKTKSDGTIAQARADIEAAKARARAAASKRRGATNRNN